MRDVTTKMRTLDQRRIKWNLKLRRLKAMLTLYSIIVYAVYSIYLFFGSGSRNSQGREGQGWTRAQSIRILGLIVVPLLIGLCRHMIQAFIRWMLNSMDERRKSYEIDRKDIVDEIKKNLSYNSARAILDRYDVGWNLNEAEHTGSSSGLEKSSAQDSSKLQKRNLPQDSKKSIEQQVEDKLKSELPQLSSQDLNDNQQQRQDKPKGDLLMQNRKQDTPSVRPMPPTSYPKIVYEPKWYDRILEGLVGDDEQSPNNRYALICPKCYAHNGLCRYGEDPQYVIYICPHCGHKNGKERNLSPSPSKNSSSDDLSRSQKDKESESFEEVVDSAPNSIENVEVLSTEDDYDSKSTNSNSEGIDNNTSEVSSNKSSQ